jgi:hypothetical protein
VFELTPSASGWTETLAYTFPTGTGVTSLLVGQDGNFYGVADQYVYQLIPSRTGWTLKVIHPFQSSVTTCDSWFSQKLLQDRVGNLFGIVNLYYEIGGCGIGSWRTAAVEYKLSPSNQGWTYTVLQFVQTDPVWYNDSFNSLTIDANGNTYVAGTTLVYDYCPGDGSLPCYWYVNGGDLNVTFQDEQFWAASLAVDPAGQHLYGIETSCGQNERGSVWEISPPAERKHKQQISARPIGRGHP